MEARDLEGARACFGRAAANAATDEEAAVAYKERGVAAHRLGDLEAAIADYTRALGRRSDFAMVYNNRGAAYLERGEYERARADCTAALNLAGAGRGAEGAGEARQILIFSYSNRGEALLALGRDAEAEADYAAAIALDAASGDAFLGRALARASGGDAPGALADLRRARELLPEDPLVAFHCARLHYDAGHLDEAAALLDESLGRLPDARAYRLRGRVRERQGDLRAAAEDYERALCFDPRMEGAEEMRRFIAAHLRPGG
jgi:tetratricopeptide (TPR) repeat protein